MRHLSNFLSSKPTTQILLETKRFKGLLRVFGLCDLPETFIKKIFENFPLVFFERFSVGNMVFFCFFQLGKNGFRVLCVYLRVFFGAV